MNDHVKLATDKNLMKFSIFNSILGYSHIKLIKIYVPRLPNVFKNCNLWKAEQWHIQNGDENFTELEG